MSRGLDHIVHAVRDLDAAAKIYRRMGFAVGARNRHAWGTHNHVVQFAGNFIELLTVAEPEKLGSDDLSRLFGRVNQSFLARQEGLAMMVLESADADADVAAFAAAGIAISDLVGFEREGRRPDGSTVKVGFSLAFAHDAMAPEIGFFTCKQRYPENFWNPALQQHPNTVTGIVGAVLVAENPTDHHIFLSAFAGERELLATSTGITVKTPRGEIQVMDPAAFTSHFGASAPDISGGARLAAIRLAVSNVAIARDLLDKAEVAMAERMGRFVVPPTVAMGATLVFEAA
jgi:catechol 2,3-dioxygenase-like lactoylglutathione lyase family enzyme